MTLFWWIKRKGKFIFDNTLRRGIFQTNKEGCDCILFGCSFENQSKVYRLNLNPRKVSTMIPILIHMVRRSSQVSVTECGKGIYITVPKIIFRLHIVVLPSELSWTLEKCFISAELLNVITVHGVFLELLYCNKQFLRGDEKCQDFNSLGAHLQSCYVRFISSLEGALFTISVLGLLCWKPLSPALLKTES